MSYAEKLSSAHGAAAIPYFKALSRLVARDELNAYAVARAAVFFGFLMIGTTQTREVHEPVPIEEHRYKDLRKGGMVRDLHKPWAPKLLRATGVVDIAISCALWGDFNNRAERMERIKPIIDEDREYGYFGWGIDGPKTQTRNSKIFAYEIANLQEKRERLLLAEGTDLDALHRELSPNKIAFLHGIHPREEACVSVHARPELINAATNPERPLRGRIDFVLDDIDSLQVCREPKTDDSPRSQWGCHHEFGSWLTTEPQQTAFSLPIVGNRDLPLDIIPQDYPGPPK